MRLFVERYCEKSGTFLHPQEGVAESVILGLAQNVDEIGRPLCPVPFLPEQGGGDQAPHVDLRLRRYADLQVLPLTALR